jgi:ABC-type Na+ efflux pump permease subunit
MNRSLLILFLLIFTSACTVQKRLHRPGWHVSWNKKYKQNKGSEELEEKSVSIESTEEEEFSSFEHEANNREEEDQQEYKLEHEQLKSTSRSEYIDQLEIEITTDTLHTPYERDTYISKKSSEESKSKTQFGSHHPRSIVFFMFFMLCTLGVFAIFFNLSFSASLSAYIISLLGIAVLVVLGFIFFIIAIVTLFSNSKPLPKNIANPESSESKEKEENKSPDQEQPKELETEKTEQENTTEDQGETSRKSDSVAILLVAIAAILVFFLIYY